LSYTRLSTWWDVRELVYKYKVFDISYKSRSHTFYKFAVPIDEVERRLNEYQLVKEPLVSGQGRAD